MAANIKRPLPIVLMSWPSTVTDADLTRWITAAKVSVSNVSRPARSGLTFHGKLVSSRFVSYRVVPFVSTLERLRKQCSRICQDVRKRNRIVLIYPWGSIRGLHRTCTDDKWQLRYCTRAWSEVERQPVGVFSALAPSSIRERPPSRSPRNRTRSLAPVLPPSPPAIKSPLPRRPHPLPTIRLEARPST